MPAVELAVRLAQSVTPPEINPWAQWLVSLGGWGFFVWVLTARKYVHIQTHREALERADGRQAETAERAATWEKVAGELREAWREADRGREAAMEASRTTNQLIESLIQIVKERTE